MRISTSLMYQTGLSTLGAQQSDLMHLFQQIGTGRRLVTPADDPLAAAQALNMSQTLALNTRYADNRAIAKQNLGIEENTLNSVTQALQDIKTRVVEAGNGTYADANRRSLADVLKNYRETLLGYANATDGNGQHLFSGYKGDAPAYVKASDGSIVWSGDSGQRMIQVDQTRRMSSGDVGADIFNRATPGTNSYVATAHSSNSGTGLIGSTSVTDPAGANVGKSFSIAFSEVDIDGDGTLEMAYTVTIDDGVSSPTSLPPQAYVDGQAIDLGGVSVVISGQPEAGDAFETEPAQSADLDLFATLDALIEILETPVDGDPVAQAKLTNILNTANQKITINHDNVLTVRASVGARLDELDKLDANGAQRGLGYEDHLSKLENVDWYQAISDLQLRQTALQAAAMAFQSIQANTSLFMQKR